MIRSVTDNYEQSTASDADTEQAEASVVDGIWKGAAAGVAATAAMTLAMEEMFRLLPPRSQYPLPPRQITIRLADQAGIADEMTEDARQNATLAAHFGYGSTMGAVYGVMSDRFIPRNVATGVGWGMAVWAMSYLGALPALGILSPATRHPIERTALMVIAHGVWGAMLGATTRALSNQQSLFPSLSGEGRES